MPRTTWKGAISFGLITIPVKLYTATQEKDISFHQVHSEDGGRIRYQRVCEKCGKEVEYANIAKGYEASDGRIAVLTKEDFDGLPLATGKAVEIMQFVDESEIDPVYFEKTYYIEADGPGTKPYVLLRDVLAQTGKAGVVKVSMRSRESLALVRPKGDLLVMDTMLWPDEVRDGEFAEPEGEFSPSDAEVAMARSFVEQLTSEWNPEDFQDGYREALEKVVSAKLEGTPMPEADEADAAGGEVVDLVAALKASVEAAKKRRAEQNKSASEKAS